MQSAPEAPGKPPILSQGHAAAGATRARLGPGKWIAVAFLGLTGVAAFGIAPQSTMDLPPVPTVVRPLPLPELATPLADEAPYWREERVQRGDTIAILLARAGVDDAEANAFLRTDLRARALYQLKPGQPVRVAIDGSGRLQALRFLSSAGHLLSVERLNDAFFATYDVPHETTRLALKSDRQASARLSGTGGGSRFCAGRPGSSSARAARFSHPSPIWVWC